MRVDRNFIEQLSKWVVCIVFSAILFISICVAAFHSKIYLGEVIGGIACGGIIYGTMRVVFTKERKLSEMQSFIMLLALTVIVKFLVVLLIKPVPNQDDLRIFQYCGELLENGRMVDNARFIALFPHLLGYVSFLVPLFKVFGYYTAVARLANAFLSVIAMAAIYGIARNLSNRNGASAAALLWIISPMQSLWNCFVLSETYYTTLLLLIFLLIIRGLKKEFEKRIEIFRWIAIGILLSLFNMTRPVAIVVILALILTIIFIYNKKVNFKSLLILIIVGISFLACQRILGIYTVHILGQSPAGLPWYSIAVGSNEKYGGLWNIEDWRLLFQYSNDPDITASDVQMKMLPIAISHIRNITNLGKFLVTKIWNLVGNGKAVVQWLLIGNVDFSVKIVNYLKAGINIFFYGISILGFWGGIRSKKNKDIYIVYVAYIGLFLSYMLVEVQGRYNYPLFAILILLAGVTVGTAKDEI